MTASTNELPTDATSHEGPETVPGLDRKDRILALLAGDLRALPIAAGLIVLGLFFASQSAPFLTSRNLSNLIVQSVVTGIIALGLIFVLLLGEIDLSVAATSGATAVFMAKLVVDQGLSVWLAVGGGVLAGLLIGAVVGFWITRFDVPSFVVTLGAGLILGGVQLLLLPATGRYNLLGTGVDKIADTYIVGVGSWLVWLVAVASLAALRYSSYRRKLTHGLASSLVRDVLLPVAMLGVLTAVLVWVLNGYRGIPMPVIVFAVLLSVAGFFVTETAFGVHLYAVGGSGEAALRAGINVPRVKITSFALAGALAAIAGIIAASRILGVSVSSGGGVGGGTLLLDSIAAAVIGGVSLFGGRGRVSGALLGALIIGTVSNGLNLMGVDTQVKYIVTGSLLVLAVTLDCYIQRQTSTGGR